MRHAEFEERPGPGAVRIARLTSRGRLADLIGQLPTFAPQNSQSRSLAGHHEQPHLPAKTPMTAMLCTRCFRAAVSRRQLPVARQFATFSARRTAEAPLSTPTTAPGEADKPAPSPRSVCPEGTVLVGLNYMKGGKDPVALKDEEYPEWLWSCLDGGKKKSDGDNDADGDEFCTQPIHNAFKAPLTLNQRELTHHFITAKSKRKRQLAAKRQKAHEAKLLAEGNLDALAPKVPIQHQSINLPGAEGASLEENVAAAEAREALKKAMRKERRVKIKESNYLRSM
ncbi:hypothetical protein HIM_07117 [Hirsutella minnesotensis 3608]|uniref:Large ribosomal subunit protein mL54 n=1 Tax=Hirsutella minnesotensis 3608 TaxID=1043627 RepID=A0A0F7ZIA7_9HYPO|nr:hypothetical protein HIM_07117 [Hirsutella minnesotensis 3608]